MKDGSAYGGLITVEPDNKEYNLSLNSLKKVKLVTLPRPYPTFLPYYFEDARDEGLDIRQAEALQISIGPGIPEKELSQQHGVAIESIGLE
jgi:hypothetical protein